MPRKIDKGSKEFRNSVAVLMTGSTLAQFIPIAISPIITRIFTPEEFGIYAIYLSIVTVTAVFATGRYELAIMLPKDNSNAINVVALSGIISAISGVVMLVVVYLFNYDITKALGNTELSSSLYFVPFAIMFTGWYQSLNYWFNRKKKYKHLAVSKVGRSSATAGTNVALGVNEFGSDGLVIGGLSGQVVSTMMLARWFIVSDRMEINSVNLNGILLVMRKYVKFPKYDLPSALLNSLGANAFILIVGRIFGASYLGYYSFANRILITPVSIVAGSVSDVVYQKLSSLYIDNKHKDINSFIDELVSKMFVATAVPFLLITGTSKYYIPFIFGDKWHGLHHYFVVLSIVAYTMLMVVPIASLLKIYNLQEISLRQHLAVFIIKMSALAVCIYTGVSFVMCIFVVSLAHVIVVYFNIISVYKHTRLKMSKSYHFLFLFILIYSVIVYGSIENYT
jgi:O-antigen/teichoic acid export membrane protein